MDSRDLVRLPGLPFSADESMVSDINDHSVVNGNATRWSGSNDNEDCSGGGSLMTARRRRLGC